MRILDRVKGQLAISDDRRHHVRELVNQFSEKLVGPSDWSMIRVLEKGLFIVFVRQKQNSYFWNCSLCSYFHSVTVGIPHEKCLAKFQSLRVIRNYARRYKSGPRGS